MRTETQTPETPALANLIDREEMLALYRTDLATLERLTAQKKAEWETLVAKADMVAELRDEARDQANAFGGKAQALRELIAFHETQATTPEADTQGHVVLD